MIKHNNTLQSLDTIWCHLANNLDTHPKSVSTYSRRLESEGIQFATVEMPKLGKNLTLALTEGTLKVTSRFKLKRGTQLPVFLYEHFSKVFETDGSLKAKPVAIRKLRQLLFVFYKMEAPFTPQQERVAYEEFIATDQLVKTDGWPDSLPAVKAVFQSLLPDDPLDIRPHHSGGATADGYTNPEKLMVRRLIPSLHSTFSFRRHFQDDNHMNDWLSLCDKVVTEPKSKLTLVPKDSRGPRKICMEPHERMFMQKGLMQKIYDHVETVSPAKGHINFTDQVPNKALAFSASITGRYATIDLKDASDMVSWNLIQLLAPEEWLEPLTALRTSTVDVNGMDYEMKKFAPMGSALCFPIEAMLFYSIIRTITSEVWVYGDDIIVPTDLCEDVISELQAYGLIINLDKTLSKGRFRESCGGEFYKGKTIKPVYLRSLSVLSFISFVNLITLAYGEVTSRPLMSYADHLVGKGKLRREPISEIGDPEPMVLYSICTRPNENLKTRWNKDLHRWEIRSLSLDSSTRPHKIPDWDLYFEWQTRAMHKNAPEMYFLEREYMEYDVYPVYGPFHTKTGLTEPSGDVNSWARNPKIKFRWTATYAGYGEDVNNV